MGIYDSKDMICLQEDCFNIPRKAYINFILKPIDKEYDKGMSQSQNFVCDMDLFTPMPLCVVDLIIDILGKERLREIKHFFGMFLFT